MVEKEDAKTQHEKHAQMGSAPQQGAQFQHGHLSTEDRTNFMDTKDNARVKKTEDNMTGKRK